MDRYSWGLVQHLLQNLQLCTCYTNATDCITNPEESPRIDGEAELSRTLTVHGSKTATTVV